jgi:hypothetical protein
MLPGWSKCSSANLMSFWILQLLVFSLMDSVVPVMLGKTAQSSVVCQSVCLDLLWMEPLWRAVVFTLLMPCMDVCVWVLDSLKRCAHLSVMKCDWEALSSNALHGTYWPDLLLTSANAVASKMIFLILPVKEQSVLSSASLVHQQGNC